MAAQPAKTAEPGLVPEKPATQRMITAARRHFFAHGFRGVTMDDLAEELGMSKKTLYASFPSKDALLRAVLLDKFRSVEMDLDGIMVGVFQRCFGGPASIARVHAAAHGRDSAAVRARYPTGGAGNIPI